jgi:ethanolamine-phosphate cytidylyltransferase
MAPCDVLLLLLLCVHVQGPPVMNDLERLTAVEGCKFVDEVVRDVPYIMNEEYIAKIIKEHRIDYVVHGDDPCIVNGKDVYEVAKLLGECAV